MGGGGWVLRGGERGGRGEGSGRGSPRHDEPAFWPFSCRRQHQSFQRGLPVGAVCPDVAQIPAARLPVRIIQLRIDRAVKYPCTLGSVLPFQLGQRRTSRERKVQIEFWNQTRR